MRNSNGGSNGKQPIRSFAEDMLEAERAKSIAKAKPDSLSATTLNLAAQQSNRLADVPRLRIPSPATASPVPPSSAGSGRRGDVALPVDKPIEGDAPLILEEDEEYNLSLWEAAHWTERIYAVAEPGSFPSDLPPSWQTAVYVYAASMAVIILLNCLQIMWMSYPEFYNADLPQEWCIAEALCVAVFTTETVVRLITCPRLKHILLDPMTALDILSLIPFFLEIGAGIHWAYWLRAVRVCRLARLIHCLKGLNILGLSAVLQAVKHSYTGMFLFVALAGTLWVILATLVYMTERGTYRKGVWYRDCLRNDNCTTEPSPVQSIPDAFWFTIVAMSTVGYGDVVMKSGGGRFFGAVTMLCGVVVIAFPTMILSGHYDAAKKRHRASNHGWQKMKEQREQEARALVSPRSRLMGRMGWLAPRVTSFANGGTSPRPSEDLKKDPNKHLDASPSNLGSNTNGAVAEPAPNENALSVGNPSPRTVCTSPIAPTGDVIGLFLFDSYPRELKKSRNENTFYYDPLFTLKRYEDGTPVANVFWGCCHQPTIIELTLLLDHPDARKCAAQIASQSDPRGFVACLMGGGFSIQLHSPSPCKYSMLRACAAEDYRSEEFHIHFMRKNAADPALLVTDDMDQLETMAEEAVIDEALTDLMGSSLLIRHMLPEPSQKLRVPVVMQLIQNTRLHRELQAIAIVHEEQEDAFAYASRADILVLLENVSAKLDLKDYTLSIVSPSSVDALIVDCILDRLKSLKHLNVPSKLQEAVYQKELLGPEATVYEVPISLFDADEDDEVEVDALGYIEVAARPFLSKAIRIDVRVDPSAPVEDM